MELHDKLVENKFVITEDRAYFLPYLNREEAPWFMEILGEVFDLDDPAISQEVEERISEGKIIMGYYDPLIEKVEIHVPLETSEYVEKRIKEVFGNEATRNLLIKNHLFE